MTSSRPDLRLSAPTIEPADHLVHQLSELARASVPTSPARSRRRVAAVSGVAAGAVLASVGGAWATGAIEVPGLPSQRQELPAPVTPTGGAHEAPGSEGGAGPTSGPTDDASRPDSSTGRDDTPADGRNGQDAPGRAEPGDSGQGNGNQGNGNQGKSGQNGGGQGNQGNQGKGQTKEKPQKGSDSQGKSQGKSQGEDKPDQSNGKKPEKQPTDDKAKGGQGGQGGQDKGAPDDGTTGDDEAPTLGVGAGVRP